MSFAVLDGNGNPQNIYTWPGPGGTESFNYISPGQVTSGTTAVTTSGDTPVTVIHTSSMGSNIFSHLVVKNTGPAPGFFSWDSGANFAYMDAGETIVRDNINISAAIGAIQVKRVSGGIDLSGTYVEIY